MSRWAVDIAWLGNVSPIGGALECSITARRCCCVDNSMKNRKNSFGDWAKWRSGENRTRCTHLISGFNIFRIE